MRCRPCVLKLDRARVEPRGEKARRTARVVVLAAGVALRVLVAHLRYSHRVAALVRRVAALISRVAALVHRAAALVTHARLRLAAVRRGSSSGTLQLQRQRGKVGERLQRRAVVDERHMVEQPQRLNASADHSLALAGAGSSSECTGLGNQSREGSSASAPGCAAARRADSGRAEPCRSTGAAERENKQGGEWATAWAREACEPAQGL
eukprot:scaffold38061_cov68-Phaeocystis_antarctica.AAC.1